MQNKKNIKRTDAHTEQIKKFEKFVDSHEKSGKLTIKSLNKWVQLYYWHGKEINFNILENRDLEAVGLFRYNKITMEDISFKNQVLMMLGQINKKVENIEKEIIELKKDVAELKIRVGNLEQRVANIEVDVAMLKNIHNL
ncbi:hypothetical protein EI74_0478 [Mycoplasma testudineum]|uniref:Uncharacterized protein n=1 Tax=Mycoplasma testudineum TaxID=244584 RepID=A0A4R6IDQ2_9MOLU|nr:hypothetical protein [Mycoplasma testudineum]OYD26865.1 hypothetical protein CG473_02010 [Mycoplasma testudineum]TDO20400.1 hypothetical protein EI74_0478 [Mycoplasma testudineum]